MKEDQEDVVKKLATLSFVAEMLARDFSDKVASDERALKQLNNIGRQLRKLLDGMIERKPMQ